MDNELNDQGPMNIAELNDDNNPVLNIIPQQNLPIINNEVEHEDNGPLTIILYIEI
jgi:hypothetical protein